MVRCWHIDALNQGGGCRLPRIELDLAAVSPYPKRMSECPHCHSQRVVTGTLVGRRAAVFRPDTLRVVALTLTGGVSVGRQSFACQDCGLMWTFGDKEKLNRFLEKHCEVP
jgi:hypothetical protein